MIKRKPFSILYLSFLLTLAASSIHAQELGLNLFSDLYQSSKTNPAYAAEQPFTIGVPGFYFNLLLPATYNDLVKDGGTNGDKIIDAGIWLENSEDENTMRSDLELETVNIGLPLGNLFLSFNHAIKLSGYMHYPKEMLQLGWEGNAQFIGQEVTFGPDFQAYFYNEFGFGAAAKLGDIAIGGKVKLLTGIGDVSTERTDAALFTSDDIYQLRLTTDYLINSSAFVEIDDLDDLNFQIKDYEASDLFTNNFGAAIDLGVKWDVNENLYLAASAIDLGSIKWTNEVNNYKSEGVTTYDGLDFSNIFREDSLTLGSAIDSLRDVFDFQESTESYSTTLPLKIYISGGYTVNEKLTLGAAFFTEAYRDRTFPAFTAGATFRPLDWLSVGGNYSWRNETADNIGLHFAAKLAFVQLYAVTDNILTAFQPYDSEKMNVRAGLNFMIGNKNQ